MKETLRRKLQKSNIDGVEYFCKSSDNEVNELVACKLAKIVGINCVEYHLVKVDGIYYYLSYSFNNIGKFKRGSDFIGKSGKDNTLYSNKCQQVYQYFLKKF